MKLFSLPDGVVDRKDRAQWVTIPFDLAFGTAVVIVNPEPTLFAVLPPNFTHGYMRENRGHLVMPVNNGHLTIPDQQ
jgi:hypothetical protein